MKKLFTLLTLALFSIGTAWADEVIFSMTSPTALTGSDVTVDGTKYTVAAGKTASVTATFNTGSSAEVKNGKSSAAEMCNNNINLGGSGASWFHATFTTALAEGDIIAFGTKSGTGYIAKTSTKPSSTITISSSGYTVPKGSELIGQTEIYYWKPSSGEVKTFTEFTITRITGTHAPSITQSGTSVTLECATDGATIYYTTDGSEPTTSSATYSTAITLTNSCTVRAFAKKGDDASDIVKKDCYVSQATAVAVLGYNGGTVAGDVWTSTNGEYLLTNNVADRGIGYVNLAGSQDGFKLNHTDSYTLKVSNNVKVTKIVVVGKSWLQGSAGNASTIAIDGFTPASGTFYDYPTDGETYVKTVEFTPTSELGYGASITLRPGTNQLGAYIEIYGTEYAPSVTAFDDPVTWDFTNWSDATITGVTGDATNWHTNEKSDDSGVDMTGNTGRTIKISRSNNSLSYSDTKIAETDGLKFTCDAYGLALLFNLQELSGMSPDGGYHSGKYIWLYNSNTKITLENVTKGSIIEIGLEPHKKNDARGLTLTNSTQTQGDAKPTAYQECKWTVTADGDVTITPTKGLHIYYITLKKAKDVTTITPANDWSTYVTTKALDFSKATDGLKAYAATAAAGGKVTLEEVGAVPAGTPLMLIGTAGTEYQVPVATSASAPAKNMFEAGDGTTVFDGTTYDYILYTDQKFYQIGSGSVAVGKAYLHCDSDPTAGSAPYLTLDFGGNVTGIGEIKSQKIENGQFFDLQGRKVAQPSKGLYIVNGKKVVIK